MTIQDWAAIGEIVGSIVVVVTLVYLARQIRDSNREARAATIQSALDAELFVSAAHAEHAETWHKAITGEPFENDGEERKAIVLFNMVMTEGENRFHQFHSGYLDAAAWDGRLASLRRVRDLPIFRIWRQSPGALNHSASFLALVDGLGSEGPSE